MTEAQAHHVLPGSMEINGKRITAGVHKGAHEWDIQEIRFVTVDTTGADPSEKLIDLLARVYENSTGCVSFRTFKMNSEEAAS